MRRRLVPSPSMAVALVALFVALGGVSYAAATIGSAQIKNNSVRGKDIRNSSITGRDVKNESLGGRDVKESALGKVPRATRADAAGTATSASRAASAANADRVGGLDVSQLRLRCPAGTRPTLGLCMDPIPGGPTSLAGAWAACEARGGRLPSLGELEYLKDLPGVRWANGQANQYEFSSDGRQTSPVVPLARDRNGAIFPDPAGQNFWHHCLTQPVNG